MSSELTFSAEAEEAIQAHRDGKVTLVQLACEPGVVKLAGVWESGDADTMMEQCRYTASRPSGGHRADGTEFFRHVEVTRNRPACVFLHKHTYADAERGTACFIAEWRPARGRETDGVHDPSIVYPVGAELARRLPGYIRSIPTSKEVYDRPPPEPFKPARKHRMLRSAGAEVSFEAEDAVKEFKLRGCPAVVEVVLNKRSLDLVRTVDHISHEDFLASLPESEARYFFYYLRGSGKPMPLFISWLPSSCGVRDRMLYSASAPDAAALFAGRIQQVAAEEADDLSAETLSGLYRKFCR